MVDPSDKANAPVEEGADLATGANSVGEGQPASPAPDPDAQIRALNDTVETLKKGFDHQRALHDQQMARMRREMQAAAPPPPTPQYVDNGYGNQDALVQQINQELQNRDAKTSEMEYRLALTSFKADNPDWRDDWSEMENILNDDANVQRVAVYDPQGRVDYGKTLSFARQTVQSEKYSASRKAAQQEKRRLESERLSQQDRAVISGAGGYSVPEGITPQDISRMSPKEMVAKGVYPIDPNDPPRFDD